MIASLLGYTLTTIYALIAVLCFVGTWRRQCVIRLSLGVFFTFLALVVALIAGI
ncbi:hypothetical protein EVC03_129 [Rhizobium phage RHph_Y5A]|nr:hypothetical protein EVC03_129 [Rhizobium phage RHph_Y5A]QIG75571.1 hypothetical protein EVC18_129 [Rhizobium phage RHph_Y2_4]